MTGTRGHTACHSLRTRDPDPAALRSVSPELLHEAWQWWPRGRGVRGEETHAPGPTLTAQGRGLPGPGPPPPPPDVALRVGVGTQRVEKCRPLGGSECSLGERPGARPPGVGWGVARGAAKGAESQGAPWRVRPRCLPIDFCLRIVPRGRPRNGPFGLPGTVGVITAIPWRSNTDCGPEGRLSPPAPAPRPPGPRPCFPGCFWERLRLPAGRTSSQDPRRAPPPSKHWRALLGEALVCLTWTS